METSLLKVTCDVCGHTRVVINPPWECQCNGDPHWGTRRELADRGMVSYLDSVLSAIGPVPIAPCKARQSWLVKLAKWKRKTLGHVAASKQRETVDLTFVTSLSPNRIRRQLTCVRTWKNFGIKIIAVQAESEIEQLSEQFPDVRFHATSDLNGHNVTLRALAQFAHVEPVVILNADLELYPRTVEQFTKNWTGGVDCRIGCRWNYRDITDCRQEAWGIDVIRITPTMVPLIDDDYCALGLPGWDWWLPAWLEKNGFALTRCYAPEFFHKTHRSTWTHAQSAAETHRLSSKYGISVDTMRTMAAKERTGDRVHVAF